MSEFWLNIIVLAPVVGFWLLFVVSCLALAAVILRERFKG